MPCIDEEILNAYFDGELAREARAAFVEHLALCEACAYKAQSMEQTIFLVGGAFDEEFPDCVPTESLRAGLDAALNRTSSLALPVSSATPPAWRAFIEGLVFRFRMLELAPRHLAAAILSGLAVVALLMWLAMQKPASLNPGPDDGLAEQNKPPQSESPSNKGGDAGRIGKPESLDRKQLATDKSDRRGPGKRTGTNRKAIYTRDPEPFGMPEDRFDLREPPMVTTVIIEPGEGLTFFDSRTTSHLEQAQMLLRSFKNASFSRAESAADLAYEREKSRELLYSNILLRRDAEADGNAPVRAVLNELEPFLLDIANLPERPSSGDLRFIKERLRRNEIVAMLQVYSSRMAPVAGLQ
ncbi:MAG: zf-HC2 domain-containing protein [Blastocatellia bacterium]|nr:zf-HC2 domain-containing protein [Blastocatellia bacterium]